MLSLAAKAALSLGVVKDGWNGFNVLHGAASRVGGLDLGLVPGEGGLDAPAMAKAGALDLLFNLGADEIDVEPGAFVVYIGTHGDRGAHRADVILPGAAYPEKTGIYVNTEGRPQFAERAAFPPGDAREDWAILRALSDALGARLPFDSLARVARRARRRASRPRQVRRRRAGRFDASSPRSPRVGGALEHAPFASPVADFYLTNPIARASRVMAECSALAPAATRCRPRSRTKMTSATPSHPVSTNWPRLVARGRGGHRRRRDRDRALRLLLRRRRGRFRPLDVRLRARRLRALRARGLLLLVCILISTAVLIYAERKIWGAIHLRRGPNVVGPWGVLQPFADFLKFILKEPVIPAGANKGVFVFAPLVSVTLALAAWAVIPVADGWAISDINVGVLYLFAISSLGVYGVIMAGWASNSKYPLLSALRSAAQMVSYEVSIGFVIITVLLCAGSLNLTDIVHAQDTRFGLLGWYWLPLLPMFVIFFVSALAETNRPPFDLVEAESELVAGYMVEYSASLFLLLFLTEFVAILTMCVDDDDPLPRRLAVAAAVRAVHLDSRRRSGSW